MTKYSYIGKKVPKVESIPIVTGDLKYLDDLEFPGMLWAKFLRSPYPHAKIVKVDVSKAEKLPGVISVLTPQEIHKKTQPMGMRDQFALTLKARYVGDEIAAVAAIDEETAEKAVDLIKIKYEKLPAVLDPEEAMKPDAAQVHEGVKRNTYFKAKLRAGNIEKGFEESDYVIKRRFTTSKQVACPLEPNAALSWYNPSTEKLTHWSTTQSILWIQRGLSSILNFPQHKIRAIKCDGVGGGFGHKSHAPYPYDVCAALFSIKTGKPVKFVLSREECFTGHRSRHPQVRYPELGVKKNGKIMAWREKIILDTGAYAALGPAITLQGQWTTRGPYKIPNMWIDCHLIYTNTMTSGAFRGFGDVQSTFVRESLLDMAAEEIGVDPVEIRRKNMIKAEDVPYTTSTGQIVRSCGVIKCLEEATRRIGWKESRPKNRGVGIASMIQWSTALTALNSDISTILVRVNPDGSATVYTSTCETGQGINTVIVQIVAEELGLSMDKISLVAADSDVTPLDLGSFGSRSATVAGTAAKYAALDAKKKILEVAAKMLDSKTTDLVIEDGKIFVKNSPEKSLTTGEVATASYLSRKIGSAQPIIGVGYFDTLGQHFDENGCGNVSPDYAFAVNTAEVEVDPETGQVKLLKYIAAQDAGQVLNILTTEGQIQGGAIQGIGYALMEDFTYDKAGQPLITNFTDYKVPRTADLPEIVPITVDTISPATGYGQKGVGETAVNCAAAAIANAIYDAIGVRVREVPITPEKILKSLKEKKKEYPFDTHA